MGRPRTPTRLKALRGTLRPDRVNAREPQPALGFPPARRGMARAVRACYRRLGELLSDLGVLTVVDGIALELAAAALAEYEAASQVVLEKGHTYEAKTEAGTVMHRTRPEVAIAADAWRRASSMLQQFGLTPASRPKVESDSTLQRWPRLRRRQQEAAAPKGPGRSAAPPNTIAAFIEQRARTRRAGAGA